MNKKLNTVEDLLNIIKDKNFDEIRCHNEKNGMFKATTQGIEIDHENNIVEFYCALVSGTYSNSNMIAEVIKEYKGYELKIYGVDKQRYSVLDFEEIKGFRSKESLFLYVKEDQRNI